MTVGEDWARVIRGVVVGVRGVGVGLRHGYRPLRREVASLVSV